LPASIKSGTRTLCDTKLGLIVKATLDSEEVFTLGYPGLSDAYNPGSDSKKQKWSPTNLAIAPNGDIYVGDHAGNIFVVEWVEVGRVSKLRRVGRPFERRGTLPRPAP